MVAFLTADVTNTFRKPGLGVLILLARQYSWVGSVICFQRRRKKLLKRLRRF